MQMNTLKYLSVLAVVAVLFSCRENSNPKLGEATVTTVKLPDGFEDFYQAFHADSLFQMQHINWPLQGLKGVMIDSARSGTETIWWQPEQWHLQRLDWVGTGDYEQEWSTLNDKLVIERIRAKSVPYGIERRFSKQPDGNWELIYYADIHEFK